MLNVSYKDFYAISIGSIKKMSESKREEIKNQILDWISQEENSQEKIFPEKKWTLVSSGKDKEHGYYFTCRLQLSEDTGCNVSIEEDIDRVNVMTNVTLTAEDAAGNKVSIDRNNFWANLKINLMHTGVRVIGTPSVKDIDSLQLSKLIYFDGWSRDKFMEAIFKVIDALELSAMLWTNFSTPVSQQGHQNHG